MKPLRTHWLTPDTGRDLFVVGPSLGTGVSALWLDCARELAGRAEVDVLAWDLPGHGDGEPETQEFTLPDLAEAVTRAVHTVRPDAGSGWVHAGVSVGGATGLHLALARSVRASAVLCSGARLGTQESWAERARVVRRDGTAAMVDGSRQRWFAPGIEQAVPATVERLLTTLVETDDESYALVCGALGEHDVRKELGRIQVPVLLLGGAHDVVAPPEMQHEMGLAIPGCTVKIVNDAAHLAPAEAPRDTADALAGWLSRLH